MLAKILCFISGGIIGVMISCCFVVAGKADEESGMK